MSENLIPTRDIHADEDTAEKPVVGVLGSLVETS